MYNSAESFGVKGVLIKERNELLTKLQEAFECDAPVLIDVHVRRGENCYPMVPPGKSNAQMVGLPTEAELPGEINQNFVS